MDTLVQTVTIPSNCVSANLTYWVEVDSTVTNATKQAENNLVLEILNSEGRQLSAVTNPVEPRRGPPGPLQMLRDLGR